MVGCMLPRRASQARKRLRHNGDASLRCHRDTLPASKSSFKLNIHNRCLNANLVSPAYIIHGWSECYRAPDHQVCTGDVMRSGFIIKSGNEFDGALIYRLQRKQSHESTEVGEDTSSVAQLLVVWRISASNKLYADVLLVGYDKRLDRYDLKELHYRNFGRFRLYPDATTEAWSLDGNSALKTTFNIMNKDHILNITISEVERNNNTRIPAHIDSER
jgi:hypothetical protein